MRALLLLFFPAAAMAQSTIVLQCASGDGSRFATYRAGAEGLEAGPTIERDRAAVAALAGDVLYLAVTTGDASGRIERVPLAGPPRAVDVERAVVSIFGIGDRCWIGGKGFIDAVDFAVDPPHVETVHRWEPARKPVDFFLRDGSWLVGVDDVAMPFDAHVLELDEAGRATYRSTARLPSVINGHYAHGASGPGRLYFHVPFGVMSGSGHGLASFETAGLRDLAEGPINAGSTRAGWVEEFASRADPADVAVLAGSKLTRLAGLAVAGGALLAAAGERGVLAVTLPLGGESKGTAIDVGGPCLDVVVLDGRGYALVDRGDRRELAVLAAGEAGTWSVAARHEVDPRAGRFVR